VQLTPAFAVERSDPFRPRPARPFPHRLVADPRDAAALLLHRHAASIHASRRSIGGGPPPTVPLPPCRVTPAPAPPPACPPARPARGSASSAQSADRTSRNGPLPGSSCDGPTRAATRSRSCCFGPYARPHHPRRPTPRPACPPSGEWYRGV